MLVAFNFTRHSVKVFILSPPIFFKSNSSKICFKKYTSYRLHLAMDLELKLNKIQHTRSFFTVYDSSMSGLHAVH